MKKIMKNFSSVVLAILLVLSSMTSVNVFAKTADPLFTVGNGSSYDIDIGVDSAVTLELNTANSGIWEVQNGATSTNTKAISNVNKGIVTVLKLPVPKFSGTKCIDKYILRFSVSNGVNELKFKKVSNNFPNDDTTAALILDNEAATTNAAILRKDAGSIYNNTSGKSRNVKIVTVDISSYANEKSNEGLEYFYIGIHTTSTYQINTFNTTWNPDSYAGSANVTFNYMDAKPWVYYTSKNVDLFTYTSATNPATSDDALEFTFNNPVASSSVTPADFTVTDLSGEVIVGLENIAVSGNKVSLELDWEDYNYYSVAFNGDITDIYNQTVSVNEMVTFAIEPAGTTQSITSDPLIVMCNGTSSNCANTAHTSQTGRWVREDVIKSGTSHGNKVYFQGHYILFRFDLSSVPAGKNISNAMFSFRNSTSNLSLTGVNVLAVDDYEWTVDSGVDTAYLSKLDSATSCAKLSGNTVGYKDNEFYADVSAAVAAARTSGKNKITFAVYYESTSHAFSTEESGKAPALSLTLTDPTFNALTSDPAKFAVGVPVNKTINLELGTILSDGGAPEDCVELIDVKEDSAASAAITANGSKITIDPASDLAENTEYAVVLKEGTIDAFGNELSADKIICRFTTGLAIEFDDIYFTSDASPVYDTSAEITGYNAGASVTALAQVTNNTSADYSAIMIIALYDSDGSLLKVDAVGDPAAAPAGATTQFAKTISVPADADDTTIKAFVWRDLSTLRPISKLSSIEQN